VAVKVTGVFAQRLLAEGDIETLAGSKGFTVMVTAPEVAGLPDLQVRLDVIVTYTWSPLAGTYEYEGPVPTAAVFLNH